MGIWLTYHHHVSISVLHTARYILRCIVFRYCYCTVLSCTIPSFFLLFHIFLLSGYFRRLLSKAFIGNKKVLFLLYSFALGAQYGSTLAPFDLVKKYKQIKPVFSTYCEVVGILLFACQIFCYHGILGLLTICTFFASLIPFDFCDNAASFLISLSLHCGIQLLIFNYSILKEHLRSLMVLKCMTYFLKTTTVLLSMHFKVRGFFLAK